jgi:hypothetical protein
MRLSDLYDARVRNAAGKTLGRVHEVHCAEAQVTWLGIGAASLLERLTGGSRGRRIAWAKVTKARAGEVIVEE